MPADLTALPSEELQALLADVLARMRPVEQELASMRAERDVLLTEVRRRERVANRSVRASVKEAMAAGRFPTVGELMAAGQGGSFDTYRWHLKTGGEVRLGFPGARQQSVALTDGRRVVQAKDLDQAAELYSAGWEPGSPGRPGVRVHFPGTRQERLAGADELYARPAP